MILDLDASQRALVAWALARLDDRMRADGIPERHRAWVTQLRDTLSAANRQEPTNMDGSSGRVDGAYMPDAHLLTVNEAAAAAGVSKRTIERVVASGELASVTVGRARRVRRVDLEQWIASLRPAPMRDLIEGKQVS